MLPYCDYYGSASARDVCQAVKNHDGSAVAVMADWYVNTQLITENCTVIPVPQHTGRAKYTLAVCRILQKKTGCRIADVLRCRPRESLAVQKKAGIKKLSSGIYAVRHGKIQGRIYLIDNVSDTGLTMKGCVSFIPEAEPFAFASGISGKPLSMSVPEKMYRCGLVKS